MLNARYFPSVQTASSFLAEVKAEFLRLRYRLLAYWIIVCSILASVAPAFAQSVSIDIAPEDLDVFFAWFNTMFGVILPIALIGAGLVAGATFAFIVGAMLKKAFQSLGGGG